MAATHSSCCSGTSVSAASCCGTAPAVKPPEPSLATSEITFADRLDHFLARWGVDRMGHAVKPGLYRLGNPTPDSPVFVSANYTLSFDALRSALKGADGFILVLDTKGVNVWCAAGKGTFGTGELVRRIALSGLFSLVRHRTLILPQLAAPGISAHEVQQYSGFRVEYGPVRARDLPEYLKTRTATAEMRRVRFPLHDRLVLAPIELVQAAPPALAAAVILYLLASPLVSLAAISAVLAGTVLFPALLPFIPTRDFSAQGLILGVIVAIPFAYSFAANPALPLWAGVLSAAGTLLLMPAVTAYLALNFTGSTTFTSRTGVKKEIFRYIPLMALMAASGTAIAVLVGVVRLLKVA
jgi:hypothetical protein